MFTPPRLTLARTRRGLTAPELARKSGVTTRAVTDYEHGKRQPKPATVESLAAALGFPAPFFAAPEPARPQEFVFRTDAPERAQATCAVQLAIDFANWLDRVFTLPAPDLPEPGTSASEVRRQWGLSNAPAPNMVQLLESRGVRVFSLPVDCAAADSFSGWHNGTPFVFLNPNATPEQARFDAAREFGTLLRHDDPAGFAADFLGRRLVMTRREGSRLLAKVFRALRENGTTPHHVARELSLGLEDLNGLVFGLVLTALPGGREPGPRRRARLTLVH